MNRSILAIVLGGIANFFFGFLIYGLILMDFMKANTTEYEGLMKEDDNAMMLGYFLGSLVFAAMITYILNKIGNATPRSGLTVAAVVSLFTALSFNLMFFFGMNLYSGTYVFVDSIAYTVMGGLTGLVIGFILRKKE